MRLAGQVGLRERSYVLPDYLEPGLKVVFVGTSVATDSARRGHYYAGRGNGFWELLWEAGLTGDRILSPEQDTWVLRFGIGLTDLVKIRAASSDSELLKSDYDLAGFIAKIEQYQPRVVAFNGIGAAKEVGEQHGDPEPDLGFAEWRVGNSRVYVLPSSSGRNSNTKNFGSKGTKAAWWRELGRLCN